MLTFLFIYFLIGVPFTLYWDFMFTKHALNAYAALAPLWSILVIASLVAVDICGWPFLITAYLGDIQVNRTYLAKAKAVLAKIRAKSGDDGKVVMTREEFEREMRKDS